MSDFQQRLLRNVARLPEKYKVEVDNQSCQMNLGGFLVFFDYNKRKGMKMSSAVYEFSNGIADGKILAFLKDENKKKKKGEGKVEWDGNLEVLFQRDYPKDIIEDDKVADLGAAIKQYHNELMTVRRKMLAVRHDGRSEKIYGTEDPNATLEQARQQPSQPNTPSRRTSKGPPKKKMEGFNEEGSVAESTAGSISSKLSVKNPFRKSKKKKDPDFVQLDDLSDDESIGLLYG